jgi:hypothetical protein
VCGVMVWRADAGLTGGNVNRNADFDERAGYQ